MATYQGHNEDASGNILLNIGNGMTATVELGSTASQAYTKGAYLFFNNRFCKATSAIASGTTLAIGTNLSETTIGTELTSHLRSSDGKEFYFDVKDGSYGYYPSASKTASEFVPFGGSGLEFKECLVSPGGYYYVYDKDWNKVVDKISASWTSTYFKFTGGYNIYAIKPATFHLFLENNTTVNSPHRVVTVTSASASSPVQLSTAGPNSVMFAL